MESGCIILYDILNRYDKIPEEPVQFRAGMGVYTKVVGLANQPRPNKLSLFVIPPQRGGMDVYQNINWPLYHHEYHTPQKSRYRFATNTSGHTGLPE
ncbi:MAG: hypothetical protein D3909_12910 [Candidatus Electrothrix sp. ATG1]|nr:hypothetical protein [Candidatus Electrothrix sp. ATG1]